MPQVNESGSMLAIAEGSQVRLKINPPSLYKLSSLYSLLMAVSLQLSIWDLRTSNNGGCIHRISGPIGGIIYSLCSSPSGPIAVGGTDRTVTIYDPRRLGCLLLLVWKIRWIVACPCYPGVICISFNFVLLYLVPTRYSDYNRSYHRGSIWI